MGYAEFWGTCPRCAVYSKLYDCGDLPMLCATCGFDLADLLDGDARRKADALLADAKRTRAFNDALSDWRMAVNCGVDLTLDDIRSPRGTWR